MTAEDQIYEDPEVDRYYKQINDPPAIEGVDTLGIIVVIFAIIAILILNINYLSFNR